MPSENLRWETLDALKNSPKGKLKYSSDWLEKEEVRPAHVVLTRFLRHLFDYYCHYLCFLILLGFINY